MLDLEGLWHVGRVGRVGCNCRTLDAGRIKKSVNGGKYKLVDSPLSIFMIMGHDKLNALQWSTN